MGMRSIGVRLMAEETEVRLAEAQFVGAIHGRRFVYAWVGECELRPTTREGGLYVRDATYG